MALQYPCFLISLKFVIASRDDQFIERNVEEIL